MRITVLGSGSRGNSSLVEAGGTRLLVDAGLPPSEVRRRAAAAGLEPVETLDAILVTHAHGDHVGHLHSCAEAFGARTFATAATRRSGLVADVPSISVFGARTPFRVGAIEVRPLPVPHDAPQVALVLERGGARAGLVTDLGVVRRDLLDHLDGCATLLFEFNHDPMLLGCGPYPETVRRRVASGAGHLSNAQAASAIEALRHGLRELVLMHVSEANNEPHLALRAAEQALGRYRSRVRVRVAASVEPTVVDVAESPSQLALPLASEADA